MASENDKARLRRVAFQRFGLGMRLDEAQAPGDPKADLREACLAEIDPARVLIRDASLPKTARGIQIVAEIGESRRLARQARREVAKSGGVPAGEMPAGGMAEAPGTGEARPMRPPMPDRDEITLRDVLFAEMRARFEHGVAQPVGFAERWVMFWSNHFCVALRRGQIMRGTAGAYEREAIRPHVFGRFADLLTAVETHPAMLHYLDQRQSIGPNSPAGLRQKKGLNENLAREILELHTLGVGGGYAQADVTRFARILTGWSISGFEDSIDGYGGFIFAANRHEPGAQEVLGKLYAQEGKAQGLAVLADLAVHPATATFIATKLVRHFIADTPPAGLVQALATEFRRSRGDLAALARRLITEKEAWSAPLTKLRPPAEFVLAVHRATGDGTIRPNSIGNALNLMGQPLWNPPGPNGHPDDEASLAAPKAIKTRLDLSMQWARPLASRIDPRSLAETLYGAALSGETRQAIARAETRPQGLAILLMSPEFQRR